MDVVTSNYVEYSPSSSVFEERDAFVGYHKDTPPSVLFEAADRFKADLQHPELSDDSIAKVTKVILMLYCKWGCQLLFFRSIVSVRPCYFKLLLLIPWYGFSGTPKSQMLRRQL